MTARKPLLLALAFVAFAVGIASLPGYFLRSGQCAACRTLVLLVWHPADYYRPLPMTQGSGADVIGFVPRYAGLHAILTPQSGFPQPRRVLCRFRGGSVEAEVLPASDSSYFDPTTGSGRIVAFVVLPRQSVGQVVDCAMTDFAGSRGSLSVAKLSDE